MTFPVRLLQSLCPFHLFLNGGCAIRMVLRLHRLFLAQEPGLSSIVPTNSTYIRGKARSPELDRAVLHVHANLQLQVLDDRRVNLHPGVLERCKAVGRYGDFSALCLPFDSA